MPTIGNRLRVAREHQLLTQSELSDASGVPVITISRIENDRYRHRPRLSTLRSLARSLNVDPVWLLHGDHSRRPPEALSVLIGILGVTSMMI